MATFTSPFDDKENCNLMEGDSFPISMLDWDLEFEGSFRLDSENKPNLNRVLQSPQASKTVTIPISNPNSGPTVTITIVPPHAPNRHPCVFGCGGLFLEDEMHKTTADCEKYYKNLEKYLVENLNLNTASNNKRAVL